MRVAVIGGGAAGIMCAATINELNPKAQVFLFEKNETLGKKVIISGGGRCNVTTGIEDVKTVLKNYPRGSKFLTSALYNFPPAAVKAWFEEHGVPLKCEADDRVFPVSDRGNDVVKVFEKIFVERGTKVFAGYAVKQLERKGGKFFIHSKNKETVEADVVVLTLGGQAYRQTGSTGDGYSLAESLQHHITALAPSLHSFIVKEKWPRQLAGVALARATIFAGQKPNHFSGPFLFTHSGISGPAVFALSSLVALESFNKENPLIISIDFLPEQNIEIAIKTLVDWCQANPKQDFKNVVSRFVPKAIVEVACNELKILGNKKCAVVTKKEMKDVVSWLKGARLSAVGRGAGEEFVTAGGVELSEVDSKTMESKICSRLFFAGEILDIDGFTGGFNLQAAWATGRRAGESVANL